MPLLREVFALVKRYHAEGVMLNVETKVEAGAPSETAPREAEPRLPLVALTNRDFLQTGRPGPRRGWAASTSTTSAATR